MNQPRKDTSAMPRLNNVPRHKPAAVIALVKVERPEYDNWIRSLKGIPRRDKSLYTEADLLAFFCIRYIIHKNKIPLSELKRLNVSNIFKICESDFDSLCAWKFTLYWPEDEDLQWIRFLRANEAPFDKDSEIDPDDLSEVLLSRIVNRYNRATDNRPKTPLDLKKVEELELMRISREMAGSDMGSHNQVTAPKKDAIN